MENGNPFTPGESSFTAQKDETGEQRTEKKEAKKKKSKFSDLLARLIPKKPDSDTHTREKSEEMGLFERLKGGLNSIFGIEKWEEPEGDADKQSSLEVPTETQKAIFVPLGLEIAHTDTDPGESVFPNVHSDTEDNLLNQDSPSNTELAILPSVHEQPQLAVFDAGQQPEVTPDVSIVRQDLDALGSTHHQEIASAVIPNNEQDHSGHTSESDRPSSRSVEQSTTIIENRGGGAALLGFVAAETLSRSRDKKLKKEAKVLRSQIKKLEAQQALHETAHTRGAERNRAQVLNLQEKRSESVERPVVQQSIESNREHKSQYKQHENASEALKIRADALELRHEPVVVSANADDSKETPEKVANKREFLLQQAEKAAEQDVALEAYYERRHEAKDVPTAPRTSTGSNSVRTSSTKGDEHVLAPYSFLPNQVSLASPRQASLYKDAAKQGAAFGLALIVGLIIVVVIARLL